MNEPKKRLKVKQEKFAQHVAQGIPAARAYVEAGYSNDRGHGAKVNSCALLKTPQVAARVAEIREMADSLGINLLTIVEKRAFLAELIRTPVGSIGPDSRLCQEYYEKLKVLRTPGKGETAETGTEGKTVVLRRRVKMADKLRAIELDSKLAGHFPKAGSGVEDEEEERKVMDLETLQAIAARVKLVSPLLWKAGSTSSSSSSDDRAVPSDP